MFQMCYYHQHACLLVCLSLLPSFLSVKLQWMIQVTREIYRATLEFKSSGCAVHPRFCSWVEPPTKFKKKAGLDKTSTFRGGLLGKRGLTFFRGGGVQLSHNNLKSEIFNDKKVY